MLRLYLFGAPRIELNGRSVALRRTRALALLAYLAASGQPQERETLLGLLWPEFDQASARNNLRRELSLLKASLGDSILRVDGQQLAWEQGEERWVDVEAFRAGLAAARALPAQSPERAEALANAVALASEEFMAGFGLPDSPPFEEWQFFQREELRQQLTEALSELVGWYCSCADYNAALANARRLLALDPLSEPAQRKLMQLYALAGQPSAALRQYEACVRLLASELGAEPEEETRALYEEIKARRINAAQPAAPAASTAPAAPPPHRPSLPAPASDFVGRERELDEIAGRLGCPDCRLLTLTGPGGIGKTQLALQVAWRIADSFADGVVFGGLATISDPAMVVPTINHALKIADQGGQDSLDLLCGALATKRMLLILDNFEQVIAATPQLVQLLAAAPRLTLLITSREALRIRDELVYAVPPLALPGLAADDPAASLESEAVQLFVRRARLVRPDLALGEEQIAAVAEICRRLDGLPLAIELAAARSRMLPPSALLGRLERCLPLLKGAGRDAPGRHRTLRDALAWSYDLLDPAEQRLFRRLAVFVGGATVEAVEAICADANDPDASAAILDQLESLLAKSLLVLEEHQGGPRLRMLATIQEYAEELLNAAGELAEMQQRHADYYAAWAERANAELYGAAQREWRARMLEEYANLRAALERAQQRGDQATVLRLAGKLGRFWGLQGYAREGRAWLEAALAAGQSGGLAAELPAKLRADALLSLGNVCWAQSDLPGGRAAFAASLELYRALDDRYGMAQALNGLGIVAQVAAEHEQAQAHLEASLELFRALGAEERVATVLNNLAITYCDRHNEQQALSLYHESLALQQKLGNLAGVALVLHNLGTIDYYAERMEQARPYFEQSAAIDRSQGNRAMLASSLTYLGVFSAYLDDGVGARAYLQEATALGVAIGDAFREIEVVEAWAYLAAREGRPTRAVELFGAAAARRELLGIFNTFDEAPIGPAREKLRQELPAPTWEQAWHRGRQSDWPALLASLQELGLEPAPEAQSIALALPPRRNSRSAQPVAAPLVMRG